MKEVAYIKQFYHVVNAKIGYNLSEYEQFKFYINLILQEDNKVGLKTDIFYEYIELFQYLVDSNEVELAGQLLLILEKDIEETNSDTMLLAYYRVLSNYYRKTSQDIALSSLYIDYYKLIKRQENKMKETKVLSIKTKQRLYRELEEQSKYEKEVSRLKKKSELDALTKLPNRYRLNEVCEQWFKKATFEHLLFGIIILDIDYFKEFNDFNGHLEGDHCIREVANVIKQCSIGLFSSRFGGDEFFVISIDKKEEELYQIAEEIQKKVIELNLEQPNSVEYRCVTVSQGICVGIPKVGQTYSDFIHSADNALYRGKEATRNSIIVENLDFQ
jgi:diguanylate cyclase (GGDEF)-like protein